MNFSIDADSLDAARTMDSQDQLGRFRKEFEFPQMPQGGNQLYFAGHSLGLMPRRAREFVNEELEAWAQYGVEGHFEGRHPWLPYHELVTESFGRLVGARPEEVVAMNSLTANLHLLMVSFYRPTKKRYKILIENNTFPSDKYAADSQARFHGFDPDDAVVELKAADGEITVTPESIAAQIAELGDSLALVLLGNCNYLSGQLFPFDLVTGAAHKVGAVAGFNLAHGAGNLELRLHDWNVDFAVWCSYKYVNSGPGGIAGAFVHKNHLGKKEIPRFEGWWGNNKQNRFKMGPHFEPLETVEAWQLSNPPILQLAALRASLEIFDQAGGMTKLRERSSRLTGYMEWLITRQLKENVVVLTPPPPHRGAMLSLLFKNNPRSWISKLRKRGAIVDFREPNIVRATPAPLYNSFEDVHRLVQVIKEEMKA
jgi:kynureninase